MSDPNIWASLPVPGVLIGPDDKILDINGEDYERFRDLVSPAVLLSSDGYFTVDRDGKRLTIPIPNDFVDAFAEENNAQGTGHR